MLEQSFDDSSVTVVNHPGGYRLATKCEQVDLFGFRDLVVQAQAPSCTPLRRADLLRRCVSLHRGEPLTGVSGAWAMRTRDHLTGELLTARAQWAEAELAVGNAAAVLAPLTTLVDVFPLVEPLAVALMRALVIDGRPTEALERCRVHRQRLADEYGTDPSPQLMALYETVLRGDLRPAGPAPKKLVKAAPARPVKAEPTTEARTRSAPLRLRRRRQDLAAVAVCTALVAALGAVAVLRLFDRTASSLLVVT